jgi:hypothetical protein
MFGFEEVKFSGLEEGVMRRSLQLDTMARELNRLASTALIQLEGFSRLLPCTNLLTRAVKGAKYGVGRC